jgi:hypothetical protein
MKRRCIKQKKSEEIVPKTSQNFLLYSKYEMRAANVPPISNEVVLPEADG